MSEAKGRSGLGTLLAGAAGGAIATVVLAIAAVQGGWADRLVRNAMLENPTSGMVVMG